MRGICGPHLLKIGRASERAFKDADRISTLKAVLEFYALYGAAQKHQKATGPLRYQAYASKRGLSKLIVPQKPSTWLTSMMYDMDATDYLVKLENPKDHYTSVASLIVTNTPFWPLMPGQFTKLTSIFNLSIDWDLCASD
ncbi:hypothetical protein HAX54_034490 [Datura stramonium]|uniref:Uncharacterized protein n=1 Tax=Datura stramonium TaxID=4076 RepID=A0ABS8VER6_DATST|nr:hypothetical protein [Datura stramonium]